MSAQVSNARYDHVLKCLVRSYSEIYEPWNIVTKKSLIHATKDFGIFLEDAVTEKVMKAYENLGWLVCLTYPKDAC